MKTILISIPIGIIARNILRTDVFRVLKERTDLKIILLFPPNVDNYLKKEVAGDNIIIEEWRGRARAGFFRHFFLYPLMRNLVYMESAKLIFRYGKMREPKNRPVLYFFSLIFFKPLSRLTFLKKFCRWIDFKFFSRYDRSYEFLFDKHKIDLVFANSIFLEPIEMAILRIARRRKIKTVAMVKSWDNLDKNLIFVLPDIFLVWSEKMKKNLIKLQDCPKEKIILTGIPQFDIYKEKDIFLSRDEYCAQMGFDRNRKIIFFASGFAALYDHKIVEIIYQMVKENIFSAPCSLLIRRHFRELAMKENRFAAFVGLPNVILDRPDRLGECFSDNWDPSREDMEHLANHLYHCDILATSYSTMSLDGSFFDKPVINVAFDGFLSRSKKTSYWRGYQTGHYQTVIQTGAVKLVSDKEEFRKAVNYYLENPGLEKDGRKFLRETFCYSEDGKSGERIAKIILQQINI